MAEISYIGVGYSKQFIGRLLGLLNKEQYALLMKNSKDLTRRLSTSSSVKLENFSAAKLKEYRVVLVNNDVGNNNFGAQKIFVSGELTDKIAYITDNKTLTVELEDKEGCNIIIKEQD